MQLDHARSEASRNRLLFVELEKFLGRQSPEVQASLLAFIHFIEPDAGVAVNLEVTETGELSLALTGRESRHALSIGG